MAKLVAVARPDHFEKKYQWLLAEIRAGRDVTTHVDHPLFERIRVGVHRGELQAEDVTIRFRDQDIPVNRYGQLPLWPDGMFNDMDNMLMELLTPPDHPANSSEPNSDHGTKGT